jgi:GINS complex subunit 4
MSSDTKFQLLIVESELERIKFVVRGYLRARMIKIDKYMIFLEREPQEQVKLSDSELEYLQRHSEVLRSLYDQQFLGNLPQSLQRLDDMTGGLSMVETPDLNKAVVVRVNKSIETPAIVGTEEVFLQKDSLHLIHYRPVAHHIRDGTVQLV